MELKNKDAEIDSLAAKARELKVLKAAAEEKLVSATPQDQHRRRYSPWSNGKPQLHKLV